MFLPIAAMIVGMLVLLWSADRFVEGAAAVATKLGMSQFLIGMTIVGFGTSFPEMMVSALSSWEGASGIALGNAYGSNICNIALILGVTALINPTPVNPSALRRDIPILLAVSLFAGLQLWRGYSLTRLDAVVLMIVFAGYMYYTVRDDRKTNAGQEAAPAAESDMPFKKAVLFVVAGLALLMASSRLLVWGAVKLALAAGISELTVGLTIVAVGTSLPEFASSLAAARKGNHDIAVGNIIGSNLFNTLVVVGIAGLVRPMTVDPIVLSRDIPVMLAVTVALYLVCRPRKNAAPVITRVEGGFLFAMFVAYTLYLGYSSAA